MADLHAWFNTAATTAADILGQRRQPAAQPAQTPKPAQTNLTLPLILGGALVVVVVLVLALRR